MIYIFRYKRSSSVQ